MSATTKDLNLTAFSLIAQFLQQRNLTTTLECLETEAHEAFEELASHKYAIEHKPLLAILEEYQLLSVQGQLEQLSVEREADDELSTLGAGRFPVEPSRDLEGIHFANILTVISRTLPSDLFPAASLPKETVMALVTGSTDKTVRISDGDTGAVISVLDHQKAAVLASDFYPLNPAYLLTAGMDGAHHIVDIRTGQSVQSWKDHSKYVVRAQFSRCDGGKWLVTASYDRTVNLYRRTSNDDETPRYEKLHSIAFRGAVESICFLPPPVTAGEPATPTLVVGSRDDNYLHYIDLDPSRAFPDRQHNMNANGDDWISFTPMDIAPSPSGRHIAVYTDSKAGRLIIFRSRSTVQARNLWGTVADGFSQPRCCWDSSGRYLFATSDDRKICVFDVVSGQIMRKLEGHTDVIRGISFDADAERLISCSFDKTVRVWDTRLGERVA
ncbi:uncharacterized protein SPPG_04086 [Spizellomyces punctatus DAOM BR117]|uniref:LisH domain-containing protein n=1 Tax=Spizellomyces punctatus (strain DAOM BR117) TaxID=645134 RepID=A0A0L0HJB7_SPIPD|nr:uncharacterized protein SPPG_04086 [Spizellomyces punctatus DAOM BR117]KND00990.1 hypothetical protein SPPG_04086 [Spizellomyces punctatus DAOM BR117]|eukprot:XP_016609029.1 hypothetical protein SPPG_04086 [Spizellomyces punctatus DAOM BR117]